jgi:hypothetical protein
MKTRLLSPEGDAGAGGGSPGGAALATAPASGSGAASPNLLASQGAPGAAVVPEPFFKDWIAPDGKINRGAYDRLPESLRPYKDTFAKYETVDQLLAGFGHTTSLNGKKGLVPLPKDAPPEVKAEWHARQKEINGVPDKPEGYGIKKPGDLPDELWDGKYVEGVQSIFHKHNIPPEAAAELVAFGANYGKTTYAQSMLQQEQALAQGRRELEATWGAETPKKLALAERGAMTLGLDPKDPIFRNPNVVRAMVKAAEMVSEDKLVAAGAGGGSSSMGFRQEALDISSNPANPLHKAYRDSAHPQHEAVVAKVTELNAKYHASLPR